MNYFLKSIIQYIIMLLEILHLLFRNIFPKHEIFFYNLVLKIWYYSILWVEHNLSIFLLDIHVSCFFTIINNAVMSIFVAKIFVYICDNYFGLNS